MRILSLCALAVILSIQGLAQRDLAGTPEIKLALDRLNVLGSVLMIAAHPDDENTAVLAYWARGRKLTTGYLSCTRGEGGQNLIGPEQGDLLGVIRTQELLAARRIDGAEQFFARAIDFGFSKTPKETLDKWGHDQVLSDMVWVIRKYQPDVIVLRFSGTPRDGHGQHQASAIVGREAFSAAADAAKFPEQLKFVKPWQAKRLMFNAFTFNPQSEKEAAQLPGRIEVDTGLYDPILGRSYAEIAGISRSQHRSQAMGSPERRGSSRNFFTVVAGDAPSKDIFDGVDLTWNRVPNGARIGAILSKAAATFVPEHPERTVAPLVEARALISNAAGLNNIWAIRKLHDIDETIALCAGVWVDATADRYSVVPGGKLKVNVTAIARTSVGVAGATAAIHGLASSETLDLGPNLPYNSPVTKSAELTVPPGTTYSQPFWLAAEHPPAYYRISDQELVGRPDPLPVLTASFDLSAAGTHIALTRPVRFRYVDSQRGELTRPLTVVPPVAVDLPEPVLVFTNNSSRRVVVQLKSNVAQAAGELHFEADPGWQVEPSMRAFQMQNPGEEQDLAFTITPRKPVEEGAPAAHFHVYAQVNGSRINAGAQTIAYEHIPPQAVFKPADGLLRSAPLTVLAKRVGYVMGAGDEVVDSLRQMGCSVTLLSAEDLARGDLSVYDAIVTGVRAYNIRADLRASQHRLLDYVQNGGTLVVQYNVAEDRRFSTTGDSTLDHIGPYPLTVSRDRVTVEEAPIEFLNLDGPLLRKPNKISAKDFEGWIQERGLYFASQWDPRYQTVFSSHDPGENDLKGGTLYTKYGKGAYIFTSYAWFRQLPAGVPGAYRIFANLLSAGKAQ